MILNSRLTKLTRRNTIWRTVNGTIAVINTSQVLAAANANRTYFEFWNTHATATIYIAFNTAATSNMIPVLAGQQYFSSTAVTTSSINIISSVLATYVYNEFN